MLHPCLPGAEMSPESPVQRLVSLLTGPLSFGKEFGARFWFEFGIRSVWFVLNTFPTIFDHSCL